MHAYACIHSTPQYGHDRRSKPSAPIYEALFLQVTYEGNCHQEVMAPQLLQSGKHTLTHHLPSPLLPTLSLARRTWASVSRAG